MLLIGSTTLYSAAGFIPVCSTVQEADICDFFEVASLGAALQRQDAVPHLHGRLRDCVDLMGVGGPKQQFKRDTVAEDAAPVARSATDTKDLGDVKCVCQPKGCASIEWGLKHGTVWKHVATFTISQKHTSEALRAL